MLNNLYPINPDDELPEAFRDLSLDELQDRLARALDNSVNSVIEAAQCVRAIEAKGGDLSYVPPGMLDTLRRVAYGQILPEIAFRFAGQPARLRELSRLVLPDQKKIVDQGTVELVVRRVNSVDKKVSHDTRRVKPEEMTPEQIRQVFDRGRIRPTSEQIAHLESEVRLAGTVPEPKAKEEFCPTCGQPLPKGRRRKGRA